MMTLEMWFTLGILAFAVLFFVSEWLRVDVVALIVVVALMVTGLLSPQEAIAGFANPVVLTIAALFIIGGGILQTGLAGAIGRRMLRIAGNHPIRLMIMIMASVALLSAFMSDTGTVAVLLPAVVALAASAQIGPSRLLIPLSYGALLGGAATLIGTPPNLIVSDLLRQNGYQPFRFFDYTPVGLILIGIGILFMVLVGRRLLPDRAPVQEVQRVETLSDLVHRYQLPNNLFRLRVRASSSLIGKTIAESALGKDYHVNIIELRRQPGASPLLGLAEGFLVWRAGRARGVKPSIETTFQADDVILVQGEPANAIHLAASWDLGMQPAEAADDQALLNQEVGLAEVLLPQESRLIGKTLVDLHFGRTYRLTVLDIRRPGHDVKLDLKTTVLHFGDTLLVQGAWENILALKKSMRDFVVIGEPERKLSETKQSRAPLAALILIGMLVAMVGEFVSLTTASMAGALLMILSGCVTIDEAYGFIDWKSIVLVAGMLPMSTALENVGLVSLASGQLAASLGTLGPVWVLAGLFLVTSLFTQVLSNTATAVLLAPLALATAQNLGVQPQAFLMAVAIAASMAFASPVASPVNTLVMAAGNYRFSDYMKVGLPLIAILTVLVVLVLPLFWPF
ncbi:MAG: SLC13 family permease [Anaerolineales bacterium]|nr:SLC13 family permease [Anaerolineales bacterium]